jgi:hypothetical protein
MTFFNSGSVLNILGVIGIGWICIGFICFAYRIIYGLFCFDMTIDNSIDSTNSQNENNDLIISITNITPFKTVSCVNIPEDTIIDNDENLPIATIV